MLRGLTARRLARKKGGQSAWTPNQTSSGPSPNGVIAGNEMIRLVHRPLPQDQTVEYEEDFGAALLIQREFYSKRGRDKLSHEMAPLAYSDVELTKARQQLANQMNLQRKQSDRSGANSVPFESSVNPETREVTSARYLFDNSRMEYCRRFENFFKDTSELFSLMEACAIIFGCTTEEAKEAYFFQFLKLDKHSLEDDAEQLRALRMDKLELDERLKQEAEENEADEDGATSEAMTSLPDEFLEFAPLVKSYLAHVNGEIPIPSKDLSPIGSHGIVYERRRWRALMEKIVAEDYHKLTAVERSDAHTLSAQLNSVKLFGLKLGDVVREIVQLTHQSGGTSSLNNMNPSNSTPGNPEQRQSTD